MFWWRTGGGGLIGGIAAWYAGSAEIISSSRRIARHWPPRMRVGPAGGLCPVSGLAADCAGRAAGGRG